MDGTIEALYGGKYRTPICYEEVGERKLLGPKLVHVTTGKIRVIRERLFEVIEKDVEAFNKVVTCIICLFSHDARVLIDPKSIYSFMFLLVL